MWCNYDRYPLALRREFGRNSPWLCYMTLVVIFSSVLRDRMLTSCLFFSHVCHVNLIGFPPCYAMWLCSLSVQLIENHKSMSQTLVAKLSRTKYNIETLVAKVRCPSFWWVITIVKLGLIYQKYFVLTIWSIIISTYTFLIKSNPNGLIFIYLRLIFNLIYS